MAATPAPSPRWHTLSPEDTARQLGVDTARGLSAAESQKRLEQYGRNELAGKKKESALQQFLRQYRDFMQIILLVAAALSFIFTRDIGTTFVLLGLTVFNAVLGLRQESKA